MENPYVWSEEIKNQWAEYLKQANLNRYPDADASNIRQQLKSSLNLSDNIDILFGNGSDELIQIILLALNKEFNSVLAVEPGFVMYRLLSELLELNFSGVPLNDDFSLNLSSVKMSIEQQQPGVIFIAWPNNPTGNCFDKDELEQIIKLAPGLVVIDEAYHVFAQKTMMSCLEKYPNVLLMRTFSKLG
ncbi:MAG: aminotransferase class I/II-fold pyridoxal phosphate-dependent enzyme, partial [Proteobacteria bacterium]|nr:aminotransferase class I/II-fold pyridoxal phosphate-dependent enzyme [Pseudomonadota bacterium]